MRQKARRRAAKLRARLQKLPQELYDEIYDLTFTAKPGIRYTDRFYHQPEKFRPRNPRPLFRKPDSVHLLHVNRASRLQFARSYYGGDGAVFAVIDPNGWSGYWVENFCRDWLFAVPIQHRSFIRDVRCASKGSSDYFGGTDETSHDEMMAAIDRISEIFGDRVVQAITFGYEDEVCTKEFDLTKGLVDCEY